MVEAGSTIDFSGTERQGRGRFEKPAASSLLAAATSSWWPRVLFRRRSPAPAVDGKCRTRTGSAGRGQGQHRLQRALAIGRMRFYGSTAARRRERRAEERWLRRAAAAGATSGGEVVAARELGGEVAAA
jgi:hypothetical protein